MVRTRHVNDDRRHVKDDTRYVNVARVNLRQPIRVLFQSVTSVRFRQGQTKHLQTIHSNCLGFSLRISLRGYRKGEYERNRERHTERK